MSSEFQEAQLLEERGMYAAASTKYKMLISSSKECSAKISLLYNNIGHCAYRCVDFVEALEYYKLSISHDPTFPLPYYGSAQIHYRLGDWDKSIAHAKIAIMKCEEKIQTSESSPLMSRVLAETRHFLEAAIHSQREVIGENQ